MSRVVKEDPDYSGDSDEDDKDADPIMRVEKIPHKGCVNRIRSMYGSPIVATWNEDGDVGFYNIQAPLAELDTPE